MRPARNAWELEYAVESGGNFDSRAASDVRMRRMRHKSTEVPLKTVNTVGMLREDGLHLCPVHAMHIIRPDMSYLDPPDPKAGGASAGVGDDAGAAAGAGAAADLQPVRLSAVTARSADARRKRESFAVLQQLDADDPWVPLVVQTAQVGGAGGPAS